MCFAHNCHGKIFLKEFLGFQLRLPSPSSAWWLIGPHHYFYGPVWVYSYFCPRIVTGQFYGLKGRQLVTLLSLEFPEAKKGKAGRKKIHFGCRIRTIFTCNLLYFKQANTDLLLISQTRWLEIKLKLSLMFFVSF